MSILLSFMSATIVAWCLARVRADWRFDRLALRGFDSPGPDAGPFRQLDPTLRPLYGFERDLGALIFFALHLLACLGGIAALSTLMWFAVAVLEGAPSDAGTVAAFAGLFAAVLSIPMWLGHRTLHGLLGAVLALYLFGLWPPAVPLLLVIVVVQHDLIRRRASADAHEQDRRDAHARRRPPL